MLIDYHLHNHFSPDSEEDTWAILEHAQKRGMQEICLTNHVEWHGKDGKANLDLEEAQERFAKIRSEINEIQPHFPSLPIKLGVELEYIPEHMENLKTFVETTPLDFVLGSVHIVDGEIIASRKFAHRLFKRVDEKTAYQSYFKTLKKMVEWGHFDVVAHFDIPKKAGVDFYGPFEPEKYQDEIMEILELMKIKQIGLELNTKHLDSACREIFPHPTILKWALEVGIEHFTLSSDAHKAEDVSQHIATALDIAKAVGIKAISTYEKRVPTRHQITSNCSLEL